MSDILTFSGGKDSMAMRLLAMEQGIEVTTVFCDTGNEHPLTYEYIDYIESKLGPIQRIKADFTDRILGKREYVEKHWPLKLTRDVPEHLDNDGITIIPFSKGLSDGEAARIIENALSVLYPTGNPYLDLCLWKGRFPSRKAQFCTVFLKVIPTFEQVYFPLMEGGIMLFHGKGYELKKVGNVRCYQ